MKNISRRQLLTGIGAAALTSSRLTGLAAPATDMAQDPAKSPVSLKDYEPKSMLHVPETQVLRAKYPVIDFHTHLSFVNRNAKPEKAGFRARREDVLAVMDRKNIRMMVNLTGGYGAALEETINYWQKPAPDRFSVCVEPWFNRLREPGYPQFQADQIVRARQLGARGIKVLKTLGLFLREEITTGPLVKVDDQRFDPMWEAAGATKLPVAIHTSDPEAFFLPTDRNNERYEELSAHPDWSFHGRDFPSNRELHEARLRVVARHPKTQFLLLHVGNAEDLPWVSEWLDKYPNTHVEIGARIGELGRQPRMARKFFDRYQDRIHFGTDAVPQGYETPQQVFNEKLYEIYFRFLETEDEYFDYAPSKVPPQGRWRIYGLGLPDSILKKVYFQNAARLLQLEN